MKNILLSLLVLILLATACFAQATPPAAAKNPYDLPDGLYGEMTTESGVVVYELFYKKAPMTVANHVGLAEGTLGPAKGQPFYDGLKWFRVEANFVIQGGNGNEKSPPLRLGYSFPDEIVPGLRHDGPGTVQMANGGPDTNGSQFCFMLTDQTGLNYNHTVFGKVVRGLDVLPNIKVNDTMKIKILRLGDDAQAFKADEATFNALVEKANRFTGPKTPGPDAFLDDPDNLVGAAGRGSNFLQLKLANFERFTGGRIMARLFAKTPEEAQGDKLDAWLASLAEKLNVADKGALVVYLRDQDKWFIRLGKNSQADFIAGPRKPDGTKDPVPATRTYDEAMTDFMTLVMRTGNRGANPAANRAATSPAATTPASAPARSATTTPATTRAGRGRGTPGVPGVSQRLSVILDNLIFRLEPAARM